MSIEQAVVNLEFQTLAMMLSLGMRWGQRADATVEEGKLVRKTVRQLAPVLPPSDLYVLIGSIGVEEQPWQTLKQELLERVIPAEEENGEAQDQDQ